MGEPDESQAGKKNLSFKIVLSGQYPGFGKASCYAVIESQCMEIRKDCERSSRECREVHLGICRTCPEIDRRKGRLMMDEETLFKTVYIAQKLGRFQVSLTASAKVDAAELATTDADEWWDRLQEFRGTMSQFVETSKGDAMAEDDSTAGAEATAEATVRQKRARVFVDAGFSYLNEIAMGGSVCSDRSCIRCRTADLMFEISSLEELSACGEQ